jgi:hypothetical protein
MLRKKLVLLVMLVTLLVSLALPGGVSANCSGDDCGCGWDQQGCIYECQFEPPEYYSACRHACIHASVRCAIECCATF